MGPHDASKTSPTSSSTTPTPEHIALPDLAARSFAELGDLFRDGRVPDSLAVLDGELEGRVLGFRGVDSAPGGGLIAAGLARWAGSRTFPWASKSFVAEDDRRGRGVNHMRVPGLRTWLPFATRIEASEIDGRPCVAIDYDQPENPRWIRGLRDELREIAPGLFFGPALFAVGRGPRTLLLYFACDATGHC